MRTNEIKETREIVVRTEYIAEEIDKVCTIANWEDAVAKYKV